VGKTTVTLATISATIIIHELVLLNFVVMARQNQQQMNIQNVLPP
jgi:hypothetical protein